MRHHQGAKVEHFDVSNVIYHKFSNGGVSYTLNGENVNVMLEYYLKELLVGGRHLRQLVQGFDFVTGSKFYHFPMDVCHCFGSAQSCSPYVRDRAWFVRLY